MIDPVVITIGTLIGLAVAVFAINFWTQILDWSRESLRPWLKQNISARVADLTEEAFVAIDRAISPARRAIKYADVKRAWKKLRNYLIGEFLEIEKQAHNKFVQRIKMYIEIDGSYKVVTSKRSLSFDELPQNIRSDLIRQGRYKPLDVVKLRDKEILELIN